MRGSPVVQVLNHDDALESPELSNGFAATKAAFEARWDMLYNPPLTHKVSNCHTKQCM
jgi:hypothetical protein